ncbi:MAG: hypothetical protein HDT43_05335 [Ruminococcaceae bacterium]|nr:hypothetical protein [Oscillospiraceae bacterium]
MLKIFKRYTGVCAMILLCFFSAFLALCSGLLSTSKANDIIRTKNRYAYADELRVFIRVPKGISARELLRLADCAESCNIYLENMMIYFTEFDGAYRPSIVMKQNEPLSLPVSRSIAHIPENGIIAPSRIEFEEITIHGNSFRVIEKIDCEKYPFLVSSFTLNAADYFKAFPEALDGQKEVVLSISSNRSDAGSAYSQIQEKLTELIPSADISCSKTETKTDVFQGAVSMENIISAGLFLFALINTVIISYYWVAVRRREIAVRKAFGAGNFRVIGLVTAELLKIIGISAFLAALTQTAIWQFFGDGINIADAAVLAVGLLLSITVAVMIAMIVPVRFILHIQPSEGVKL